MEADWDPKGCAAFEALRLGVVNRYAARHITYGRDSEVAVLEDAIRRSPKGSSKVVIGGYGVGKTHLCEVLSARLEEDGYAVVRVELGSSSERAENPNAVLASVCRSLRLKAMGRYLHGASEIVCWIDAMAPPKNGWGWRYSFLSTLHAELPGVENEVPRFTRIRERYAVEHSGVDFSNILVRRIPSAMTACNLAVARINELAHCLYKFGIKGLVLMFDEAERTNWSSSSYRIDRARDMMLGLALASANGETSRLKHYANDSRSPYCPLAPSRMHSIFWFTYAFGLAEEISRTLGSKPLYLDTLGEEALGEIRRKVEELYRLTYSTNGNGRLSEYLEGNENGHGMETRAMIRHFVAALDHSRFT